MPSRFRLFAWGFLALLLFVLPAVGSIALVRAASTFADGVKFTDAASQAAEFIGYNKSIALTPEQKRLRDKALSPIPAPCCEKFSVATCCCPCNLAKSVWGLSNYLIVRQNASDTQIQQTVRRWLAFANPKGFTGDVCDTAGGCGRTFARNGCGGMDERNLTAAR